MDITQALPTFFITLREGFEAALVVGIVLACLKKAEQSYLNSWVFYGVGVGIIASAFFGILFGWLIQGIATSEHPYAPVFGEFLEAGIGLFAIAMLSWMLIWMTQQSKSLKSEVEGAVKAAINKNKTAAGWGIFGLIFIAVLREGLETVIFILATFEQGIMPAIGAVLGLFVAAGLGILLFKWGVKINIRLFFQIMGIFLLLIVAGLVISVLKHLDAGVGILAQINPGYAGLCLTQPASCLLGDLVLNTQGFLPDKQFPGIVLKALFGYRDQLYFVQIVSYFLFLITVGWFYLQEVNGKAIAPPKTEKTVS
ncbi:MAG: FTR1 family iron permease [Planktothrix agardhii]|jgi:high-affinity iron transporter